MLYYYLHCFLYRPSKWLHKFAVVTWICLQANKDNQMWSSKSSYGCIHNMRKITCTAQHVYSRSRVYFWHPIYVLTFCYLWFTMIHKSQAQVLLMQLGYCSHQVHYFDSVCLITNNMVVLLNELVRFIIY